MSGQSNKLSARPRLKVVKIGGNVVDNPETLRKFIKDFAALEGPKILVHGGGKEATRLSAKLGLETKMIEGRRVTDAATIEVVTMVYAGLVNKRIVSLLQAEVCDSIGLSGADGNVIKAVKRKPEPVDYGFVGDIPAEGVNVKFIRTLLDGGLTPVFCAIMHDGKGQALNCNADSVASALATACTSFADVELCYCFEKEGVMADVDDPSTVIPLIDKKSYNSLKESGVINSGMIPKIDNAFKAIERGVKSVIIKNSAKLGEPSGTVIK